MADRSDIETWIERTALGDRAAFDALYEATSAKLFGLVLRILKDRAEAEEVLQDVYIKVWTRAGRYRAGANSPMTWLITIARNSAIDRLRTRRAPTEDIADHPGLTDAGLTPEAAVLARSEAGRIGACLDELPQDRADAVRGAYLEGQSYADLAARFGVPLNTMRTWLRRSLQKLKECLAR